MKRLVLWSGIGVAVLLATATHAEPIDAGKLYVENCAICHGDNGDGKTATQSGLTPRPRDFSSLKAAEELSRERMIFAVTNGRRGTAMMAHKGRFTPAEIEAVVDYVRDNFMQAPKTRVTNEPPLLSLGEAVYTENCSVCHGDRGSTAYWAKNGLNPPPRDFTGEEAKSILTRQRMITSVTHGRPGTGMQPFKARLSEQEIKAVVTFIRYKFMGVTPGQDSGRVPNMQHAMPAADAAHEYDAHKQPPSTREAPVAGGIPGIDRPLTNEPSSDAGKDMPAMTGMGAKMPQGHTEMIDMSLPAPNGLTGNPLAGRDFFMKNCFVCHGVKGNGKGPRAYFNIPRPRDFTSAESRRVLNRPRIFDSISKGRLGTVMPAWSKVLDEQQIADLTEFVFRAFIEDVKPGGVGFPLTDEKKKAR